MRNIKNIRGGIDMPIVPSMKDMGFNLQPTIIYEKVGEVCVERKRRKKTHGTEAETVDAPKGGSVGI